MAKEKEKITNPAPIDITPPQPSGDYSYTLEIVMNMQSNMGQLKEAADSLKSQSKSHSEKLDLVTKDIHAAKMVLYAVGGIVALACAFIGFTAKMYVEYLKLPK